MAELTKDNGSEKYLNKLSFPLGQVDLSEEFDLELDWLTVEDDIHYIRTGCSPCTKAHYDKEENKIKIKFIPAKAPHDRSTGVFNSYVFIFINDGFCQFKPNAEKVMIQDPNKQYIRVQISGVILLEETKLAVVKE